MIAPSCPGGDECRHDEGAEGLREALVQYLIKWKRLDQPDKREDVVRRWATWYADRIASTAAIPVSDNEGLREALAEAIDRIADLPTWDKRSVPGGLHVHRGDVFAILASIRDRLAALSTPTAEYEGDR